MNEITQSSAGAAIDGVELAPCWSCKGPVDRRALFCHTCSAIQPPQGIDHFSRLGMPQRYDLSVKDVERNYFGFQRVVHPDRFAAKSARERTLAQAQAAALNDAYETLSDPLARAMHLLDLRGAPLPKDDHTIRDPELLMAAMEDREALAAASTPGEVDAVQKRAQAEFERLEGRLGALFESADHASVQKSLLRLRYLEKLIDEARLRRGRLGRS